MLAETRTGLITASDNTISPIRADKTGATVVTDGHPRYFEEGRLGLTFSAANPAAQAVSVALATTYTGILLYNPLGSGKMLVPTKVKFALSVAPAAIATIGLIRGVQTAAPTGTTALTVQSSQIGNASIGVGLVYSAATIATPTWAFQLWDGFTAAVLPAPQSPVDLEGIFQILPGGFLAIGALTAVTGLGSIVWVELPL